MIGPYDRRRKRSRCQRCAASHLKCSGTSPCSQCSRKGKTCAYEAAATAEGPIIIFGGSRHHTPAEGSSVMRQPRADVPRASPAMDDERFFYYFDVFLERNSFSGKKHALAGHGKNMRELQRLPYFLNSIRALGAMQAAKLAAPSSRKSQPDNYMCYALYSQAVVGLRQILGAQNTRMPDSQRTTILWTTLFLGMFELMSDSSGTGWLQHMVHGTAKGLEAAGPSICQTPAGARMFQQAKMFEVCRTIVFNDRTFLTEPEWVKASKQIWSVDGFLEEWRPLDSLVDIMLLCSNLRYQANAFCRTEDENPRPGVPDEARSIANTGLALRDALHAWHSRHMAPPTNNDRAEHGSKASTPSTSAEEDECQLLTTVFWSAISIYLSGEFDYEMHHWQRFQLAVPTLDEHTVQAHTETILRLTERALAKSRLSPLLFLFPLRIAGARSAWASREQRERVMRLIEAIAGRFAVGHAVRDGLMEAWAAMGVDDWTGVGDP